MRRAQASIRQAGELVCEQRLMRATSLWAFGVDAQLGEAQFKQADPSLMRASLAAVISSP